MFHLLLFVVVEINDLRLSRRLLWALDRPHALVVPTVVAIAARTRRRPTFCARRVAPATNKSLRIVVGTTDSVLTRLVPQLELPGVLVGKSLLPSDLRSHRVLHYDLKLVTHQLCRCVGDIEVEENVRKSLAVSF
jgi:hypothetical protein